MKSTTLLSLAALGSTSLAVPMMQMSQMQQGHAVAHINAEALKNNLETAKANSASSSMQQMRKRQTQPNTAVLPLAAPAGGSVPSVTLTDLDRVVSSVGVIVKGAQDDLKKIDIKDPQGITGILSQLLGNTTRAIQQGTTRIKANQKAMILPGGLGGWGVASGLGGLGGLTNLSGLGLGGVGALGGVTNGLAGLTGITGLLTSLLNTVTGLLGNLLQLGGGSLGGDGTTGGLDLGSLTDLANLSNLLGGLTGGVTGGLPLGDLSNLTGILSPELLNQLLGGAGAGQPLGVVQSLVSAVLDLVNSLLPGVLDVTGNISGGVTVSAP